MNISEKTVFVGLEKTGLSPAHINHCLHAAPRKYKFDYFGKHVSRGTVTLTTKIGELTAKFREKHGWVTEMEIL